jgi:hypothetical protein
MTVTLDPPAVSAAGTVTTAGTVSTAGTKGTAHAAPLVTCSHPRAKRGRLVLTCRLSSAVRHGKHRLTVRLMRGAHSAAVGSSRTTSARTFTITLSLPHGLKPGGYTLMIATTGGGSAIEPIAVPRVRPRR